MYRHDSAGKDGTGDTVQRARFLLFLEQAQAIENWPVAVMLSEAKHPGKFPAQRGYLRCFASLSMTATVTFFRASQLEALVEVSDKIQMTATVTFFRASQQYKVSSIFSYSGGRYGDETGSKNTIRREIKRGI
jgi:hypothetical protein